MKRIITAISLMLCFGSIVFSQSADEKDVAATVEKIRMAIVNADKAQLEALTADQLIYAHSNGRVQDKADFIKEILDPNAIDYTSVTITDQTIRIIGNAAVVRHIYSAETLTGGKPGSLKIGNMMVLQKQNNSWKLIARQAYRLQ
ncbi:MAG TPA: nuclear transport factor 2 family protein [Bacteroidales bacterium]|nr:nuclear transport factor 2 family protein [Bacteroidales bacterium]